MPNVDARDFPITLALGDCLDKGVFPHGLIFNNDHHDEGKPTGFENPRYLEATTLFTEYYHVAGFCPLGDGRERLGESGPMWVFDMGEVVAYRANGKVIVFEEGSILDPRPR